MSFTAGVFSLFAPGNPVVTNTTISSSTMNSTLTDIATGLSTCLLKDGTQTVTANIPMSSFKFTGLAAGTTSGNSVRYEQVLLLAAATWAAYTPTVTLVGGAGNTVPVYSTNYARWMQIGPTVFVEFSLSGDGGAEGAGTGTLNIALPVAAGTNVQTGYVTVGRYANDVLRNPLLATFVAGASTFSLAFISSTATSVTVTGDDQNNTTRVLQGNFFYEVN